MRGFTSADIPGRNKGDTGATARGSCIKMAGAVRVKGDAAIACGNGNKPSPPRRDKGSSRKSQKYCNSAQKEDWEGKERKRIRKRRINTGGLQNNMRWNILIINGNGVVWNLKVSRQSLLLTQLYWETCSRSAGQEMVHLLWNTVVDYRIHKSPPLNTTTCDEFCCFVRHLVQLQTPITYYI
jgi:hypothetical protein